MPRYLLQAEQYLKGRISETDLREMPSRRDYGLSCSMIQVRQMPFLNDTWSAMRLRLLDDPHVFDARTRILPFRVLLQRLHHVPHRQQGHGDSIEGFHLHAGLVGRLHVRRHDDPIRSYVEGDLRGRDRNRMAVGQDLPDALHRMQGGDFRGDEHVALLDGTFANRPGSRGSEEHGAGRDCAALHVRLPTDVDDLRHRLRMGGRAISPSRLCQRFVLVDPASRDAPPRATPFVKSKRRTREALCTLPAAQAGCVRTGCARRKGWERVTARRLALERSFSAPPTAMRPNGR